MCDLMGDGVQVREDRDRVRVTERVSQKRMRDPLSTPPRREVSLPDGKWEGQGG